MNVPTEIDFEILLHLPISELSNTCRKDRRANEICRSNYFWVQRFQQDYPGLPFDQNDAKEEYIRVYQKYYESLEELTPVLNNVPSGLLEEVFNDHWNAGNPRQSIKSTFKDSRLAQYKKSWMEIVRLIAQTNSSTAADAAWMAKEKYY